MPVKFCAIFYSPAKIIVNFLYTADVSTGLSEIANLSRSVSPAWRDNPKILGQMVNDPYRVYRRKIPNRNFRNFFVNGKQPLS